MARSKAERLDSGDVLARHLKALFRRDPRLGAIGRQAGAFEIRLTPGGFAGLARVICGQQLSVASARAIWGRFAALEGALDPATYLGLSEAAVRATGFSAGKYRTVRVIAEAVIRGELVFAAIETMSAQQATAYLTAHKGIGPWTAEIYLMFCSGHPDIFPVGDLALRKAVGHALTMDAAPTEKELTVIAAQWSPYRHAAALLFWKYYATVLRKAEGIAL
ncbi:MAG: DNA-3-methyladenine glycosylase 2 family protein [Devosia sp.]